MADKTENGVGAGTPTPPAAPADKRIEALEKLVNKQAEQIKELTEKVKAVPATSVAVVKETKKAPAIYKDGTKVYDIVMPKFQVANKDGIMEVVDLTALKEAELKVWFGKMPNAFRERE